MKSLFICGYVGCAVRGAFYGQYEELFNILLILWMFDTLTGAIRYWRLGKLSSKGVVFGFVVKLIMLSIPFLLYLLLKVAGLEEEGKKILGISFIVLSWAEVLSTIQNLKVSKTGIDITEQDAFTGLLNAILSIGNKILDTVYNRFQIFASNFIDKKINDVLGQDSEDSKKE